MHKRTPPGIDGISLLIQVIIGLSTGPYRSPLIPSIHCNFFAIIGFVSNHTHPRTSQISSGLDLIALPSIQGDFGGNSFTIPRNRIFACRNFNPRIVFSCHDQ